MFSRAQAGTGGEAEEPTAELDTPFCNTMQAYALNCAAGHAAKNQRSGTGRFVLTIAESDVPPAHYKFMKCHLLKRKSG